MSNDKFKDTAFIDIKGLAHFLSNLKEAELSKYILNEDIEFANDDDIYDIYYQYDYLTFTVYSDSSFSFTKSSCASNDIEYSTDKVNWTLLKDGDSTPVFSTWEKVYWRGNLIYELDTDLANNITGGSEDFNIIKNDNNDTGIGKFSSTGEFVVSGNPKTLLLNKTIRPCLFTRLFNDCTLLLDASQLNLYTEDLTNGFGCYAYMFTGCTSLKYGPKLPATTLANYCYTYMFSICNYLKAGPKLPATTLANGCYSGMFSLCINLTTAQELPATTLVNECYSNMFSLCNKLNYIKSYAKNPISIDYLNSWVDNVSSSGTFYKTCDSTYETGRNGIPVGWDIEYLDKPDPNTVDMEFFFITNKDSIISFSNDVEYSLNDGIWNNYTAKTELNIPINKVIGFRGNLTPDTTDTSLGIGTFSIAGDVSVYGAPKALLVDNTLVNYAFSNLFNNCTGLTDASGLILNSSELKPGCYQYMFNGCSALNKAPIELPATVAVNYCYYYMFNGCSNLTTAPEILLNDKGTGGKYTSLFGNSAPCDDPMSYMFTNCSKLSSIKCHMPALSVKASLINVNIATNWVEGVSKTGTFYKKSDASIGTGVSGIPTGWNIIDF